MMTMKSLGAMLLSAMAIGCAESPLESVPQASAPQLHLGAPASSCPLVQLPASARVGLCFNATLQPGVWHGWIIELSNAQPTGSTDGSFTRTRLNHPYVLASPQGYTPLGLEVVPPITTQNSTAFQAEFNGTLWFDVLRLMAASNGGPQTVPVVVFWADATAVGGDVTAAVNALHAAGVVNGGQANALARKIDHANDLLAKGKPDDAILVLQGFIQQVNDLTYIDQVLTPAQAQQLITWAQYMIAFI